MFAITSRYNAIATAVHQCDDGREVVYVRRRFLPQPEELAPVGEHVVLPGQRLDHVATVHFGDPEQAWRIADANRAMDPDELTAAPGRRLRITLPPGIAPGLGIAALPTPLPGGIGGA